MGINHDGNTWIRFYTRIYIINEMKPIKTLLQEGEYAEDLDHTLWGYEHLEERVVELERHARALEGKQAKIISALNQLIDNRN